MNEKVEIAQNIMRCIPTICIVWTPVAPFVFSASPSLGINGTASAAEDLALGSLLETVPLEEHRFDFIFDSNHSTTSNASHSPHHQWQLTRRGNALSKYFDDSLWTPDSSVLMLYGSPAMLQALMKYTKY